MNKFNQLVSTNLKIAEDKVTDALTMHDVPEWDSMNFLLLIAELEKEYGVTFSMDDVLALNSIGDIRALLKKMGQAV